MQTHLSSAVHVALVWLLKPVPAYDLNTPVSQVRAADVELLAGSPEGHPLATAARRWAAYDGHTGALHQLNDSSDFVAVQLYGATYCQSMLLENSTAV